MFTSGDLDQYSLVWFLRGRIRLGDWWTSFVRLDLMMARISRSAFSYWSLMYWFSRSLSAIISYAFWYLRTTFEFWSTASTTALTESACLTGSGLISSGFGGAGPGFIGVALLWIFKGGWMVASLSVSVRLSSEKLILLFLRDFLEEAGSALWMDNGDCWAF